MPATKPVRYSKAKIVIPRVNLSDRAAVARLITRVQTRRYKIGNPATGK